MQTADFVMPGLADVALIGRGGFAKVYRARQVEFERTVAVKILDVDQLDEHAKKRFVRECRAAGRLSAHPNIVTMYDAGITADGKPYIVMEYCPNGSFAVRVRDHGPLSVAEVVRVGAKVADALAAAHDAGIVHRDVKPANILVTQYGEPALADFGIASSTDASRSLQTEALTVDYAPPEVLRGGEPDVRSDLYSLGVTLYTLLTGVPPYRTSASMPVAQQLLRILNDPVPRVQRADVPPAVASVIARLMAKEPADRLPDGRATAAALVAALTAPRTPATGPAADLAAPTVVRPAAGTRPPVGTGPAVGTGPVPPPAPARTVPQPRPAPPPPSPQVQPVARRSRRPVLIAAAALTAVAAAVIAVVLIAGGTQSGTTAGPSSSVARTSGAPASSTATSDGAISVTKPASLSALMTALGDTLPDLTFAPGNCQNYSGSLPGTDPPADCTAAVGVSGNAIDPATGAKGQVTVGLYASAGEAGVQNANATIYHRNLSGTSTDQEISGVPLSRFIVTADGALADAEFAWGWTQVHVSVGSADGGDPVSQEARTWATDTARQIFTMLTTPR